MSQITTAPGPCASPSCAVSGSGHLDYWASSAFTHTTTGTVTVLKIINTISNTTRFSTKYAPGQLPPDYTPPPTNAAGTRIAPLTYIDSGTTRTTTIAYPTPHLYLPPSYRVTGSYPLANPPSCVLNANRTIPLPYVQPPWSFSPPPGQSRWDLNFHLDPLDPLGWGYLWDDVGTRRGVTVEITEVLDLVPDDDEELPHKVIKGCSVGNMPQPYAIKAQDGWKVVGVEEVVEEGEEGEEGDGVGVTGTETGTGGGMRATGTGTASGTGTGTAVVGGETGKSMAAGTRRGRGSWGLVGVASVLGLLL